MNNEFIKEIIDIVGTKNVLINEQDKLPYKYDGSLFFGENPLLVILPENPDEISKVVKVCNKYKINIVPRGGGTSLTGSSVPLKNSIVISLLKLNKILEINIEDSYVYVESGVRLDSLNSELEKYNYFFPPDPASSIAATVGGVISTNAGGLRGAKYGVVKDWVLGIEVILPNGEKAYFGNKTLKHRIGYDLTSLLIGSEGTLGIVTKAYLKISPKPEKTIRILSYFENIEKIGQAVVNIKKAGIIPGMAEMIDKNYLKILKENTNIEIPCNDCYALIIDVDSTIESVNRHLNIVLEILKNLNPIFIKYSDDPTEMENLRSVRKGAGSILLMMRKKPTETTITGDVVVPPSQLPKFLKEVEIKIKESNKLAPMLGHVGDGNIHADIFTDISDSEDLKKAIELNEQIGLIALKYGGSVSAEHGIGLEKKDLLIKEYMFRNSIITLELMKKIKETIDPNNILNPEKIFK
ncbi:MAG: FAD-linked oxidase C-terminal domain-containing protein [Candidatus Nanopusillus acidilobi]